MSADKGVKLDNGKLPLAEMFLDFKESMEGLCKIWEFGKVHYGKGNWKLVENGKERFLNALYRHSLAMVENPIDKETGLPHYHHMIFNAMAYAYFCEKEKSTTNKFILKCKNTIRK